MHSESSGTWINEKKVNLQILFLLAICGLATYPTSASLLTEWSKWDQALSHGFGCLGLFIYFIYRQPFLSQPLSQQAPEKYSRLHILGLGMLSLGWCCAQLANLQLACYLFMLLIYGFLIVNFFSWSLLKKLLPIFGLFLFAIPIWPVLTDQLVWLSSGVINFILSLSDLTLHIQENQIMTPWGVLIIADGCSGLRYLIIALLITYLLCLLNRYDKKICITFFIVATLLALITNWIRILVIILVGYYTEMQHSLVREHEFFGWILFASILFPALYLSPQYRITPDSISGQFKFSWLVLVVGLTGPAIYFFTPFDKTTNPLSLSDLSRPRESLTRDNSTKSLQTPIQYPTSISVEKTSFNIDRIPVDVTLLKSTPERKDEKIVPYLGRLYEEGNWKAIELPNLLNLDIKNTNLEILENRFSQQKVILLFRFQVGSFTTGNYYHAKLLQIPARLLGQSYFGLWIAQSNCQTNCAQEIMAIQKLNAEW